MTTREQDLGTQEEQRTQALPRGSRLVRIGNQYRVVWNLQDGLGFAWYSVTPEHLKQIYETDKPEPDFQFSNQGQFQSAFGNFYFGNVAEVSLKADTPWDDLKEKIFNQFGYVPGFDEPEIRRLLMEAYFEGWSENQWIVEYRKTNYFNNRTDSQRQWAGLSDAEKGQRSQEIAVELANNYRDIWGIDIDPRHSDIARAAQEIASGQQLIEEWRFRQRQEAQGQEGTPAYNEARERLREAGEEEVREENLTLFAEQQWNSWVGPVRAPSNYAERWGKWLALNEKSEADLENYLKGIAQSRWSYKPDDVPWEDWAAPFKSQIRDELELASLDDKDSLLTSILNTDLTGQDLIQMIRQDDRFLSTRKMYGQLSSAAADIGRRFGFIT